MHIVYVTGFFANNDQDILTGMPNYIYKISKYMLSVGYDVTILTVGKKDIEWFYDGIRVYSVYIPASNIGSREFNHYFVYPLKRELKFNQRLNIINKKNPITLVQYAGWYGVGMLYNRKFPSVLRISTYSKFQLYAKHTKKELFYINLTELMAAKNFDGIIAPSRALGTRYEKDVKRKVRILETPFEYSECEREDNTLLREKLSGKKYFIFFGRISPDKGIETIGRCINELLKTYPDYIFCFAGEVAIVNGKNMMKYLKSISGEEKERVVYLGNIPHNQLFPIIRNAECVVMPSLMDNLPNAGLEAMYLNGIVIGTRGASFDEMFEDKISGLLIEIDDSKELLQKIGYVLKMSEAEKEKMRQMARERLEKYEPQNAGKKLVLYYHKILKKRKKDKVKN